MNETAVGFGAQMAMDKPLLKPNSFESAGRNLSDDCFDVRCAERAEAGLCFGSDVGIAGVERRVVIDQVEAGVEVSLEEYIDVDVLRNVAATAEVAANGVDAIGGGGGCFPGSGA